MTDDELKRTIKAARVNVTTAATPYLAQVYGEQLQRLLHEQSKRPRKPPTGQRRHHGKTI